MLITRITCYGNLDIYGRLEICVRKGEGLNLKRANAGNSHSESNTGADLKKRSTWQTSEEMELPGRPVMS